MLVTTTADRSACGNSRSLSFALGPTVATVALLISPWSRAAEWQFTPTAAFSETYTDNLRLTSAATQQSDYVTEISPGIAILGKGQNLHFMLNYSMQNLAYANQTSKVKTNHLLNTNLQTELLKNVFFVDSSASISQQNILPFGAQATDNVNLTDNRTEVRTYDISPYFRHRFGSTASSELRYSRDSVTSSAPGALSTQTDGVLFKLDSGSAFRTIGWGVNYDKKDSDSHNAQPVSLQTSSGNLSYLVSSKFKLTANGGYEKNSYVSLGQKPQGSFWSTGFAWEPSTLTSISANAGNRYYGKTYGLSANHRSRHSVWNISYSEDVTTTQSQFLVPPTTDTSAFLNTLWLTSVPDPDARQVMVNNFIHDAGLPTALAEGVNTFSNRVFLQKSLQASVALTGAKNSIVFSLFNNQRKALSSAQTDIALLGANNTALTDEVRQTGANAVWSWRMSSRTNFNINTGYSKNDSIATGATDKNKSVRIALTRNFHPKLKGSLEVRRIAQASSLGNDYRENAVTATLSLSL